jgi:hypothetical protein
LISDSRVLIAAAKALIAQSRQSIARQSYVRVVCAWCQQPMRWQRAEATVRGQIHIPPDFVVDRWAADG